MTISTQTLQTLIATPGIGGRRGLRPLLWGKPGTGKTASLESLARAMGAVCITIIASISEPSDFLGLPVPDGNGGMSYASPAWAIEANRLANDGKVVIVFFDELTTCPPSVQAALLRVVNEGCVGQLQLHPNVVFVGAANPTDCAAGGYDLAPPSANRWMHLDWGDTDVNEYIEGILSGWSSDTEARPAAEIIAAMDAGMPREVAKAKGAVTGFLRSQRDKLLRLPERGDPQASHAWASPRSWELAIQTIAGAAVMGLPEHEVDTLIAGCVGQGVAAEFLAYQLAADLPDPEALLDAKDYKSIFEVDPKRPDRTLAVLNSVAALVCPKDAAKRKARVTNAWTIIGDVADQAADVAMIAARALLKAQAVDPKTTRKHLVKLGPVMQAMGALSGGAR